MEKDEDLREIKQLPIFLKKADRILNNLESSIVNTQKDLGIAFYQTKKIKPYSHYKHITKIFVSNQYEQ